MELLKYRGFDINFYEKEEVFIASRQGESYRDQSIKVLKKRIDLVSKQNLGDIRVYYKGWSSSPFKIWKVTSIASQRDAWLSCNGSREKVCFTEIYPVTPHNQEVVDAITRLEKEREKIDSNIERLQEKLKSFEPPADQVN